MHWAEIENNVVIRITVSETGEFGADWLMENVGGVWVAVPEGQNVSPGFTYENEVFAEPSPFVWDEEAGAWVEV